MTLQTLLAQDDHGRITDSAKQARFQLAGKLSDGTFAATPFLASDIAFIAQQTAVAIQQSGDTSANFGSLLAYPVGSERPLGDAFDVRETTLLELFETAGQLDLGLLLWDDDGSTLQLTPSEVRQYAAANDERSLHMADEDGHTESVGPARLLPTELRSFAEIINEEEWISVGVLTKSTAEDGSVRHVLLVDSPQAVGDDEFNRLQTLLERVKRPFEVAMVSGLEPVQDSVSFFRDNGELKFYLPQELT